MSSPVPWSFVRVARLSTPRALCRSRWRLCALPRRQAVNHRTSLIARRSSQVARRCSLCIGGGVQTLPVDKMTSRNTFKNRRRRVFDAAKTSSRRPASAVSQDNAHIRRRTEWKPGIYGNLAAGMWLISNYDMSVYVWDSIVFRCVPCGWIVWLDVEQDCVPLNRENHCNILYDLYSAREHL